MSDSRAVRRQLEEAQAELSALERGEPDAVVRQAAATLDARRAELEAMTAEQAVLEKQLTDSLLVLRSAQQSVFARAGVLVPGIQWLVVGCLVACCLSGAFVERIPPLWAFAGIGLSSFGLGVAYERRARAIEAALRVL